MIAIHLNITPWSTLYRHLRHRNEDRQADSEHGRNMDGGGHMMPRHLERLVAAAHFIDLQANPAKVVQLHDSFAKYLADLTLQTAFKGPLA
ncbi:MAG: hypothetical protein WC816_05840 [Sphingomonas sp.]|jgi:hypothetical protein